MRLRSDVAVVVVYAGGYGSDLTPGLGISICHVCGPKETKKERKKETNQNESQREKSLIKS